MSDFSVIVISMAVIVLCWAVVRINQKIDDSLRKPISLNDIADTPQVPAERETAL